MHKGMSVTAVPPTETCPECNAPMVNDHERGVLLCSGCGLVDDQPVFDQWGGGDSRWNTRTRSLGPFTDHTSLSDGSTQMFTADLNALEGSRRLKFYRLRQQQNRTYGQSRLLRNLGRAHNEIKSLASNMGIPEGIVDTALQLYATAQSQGLRGIEIQPLSVATLFVAARQHCTSRYLHEFADATAKKGASKKDKRDLQKRYYRFVKNLLQVLKIKLPPQTPEMFISRYVSDQLLSEELQFPALSLCQRIRDTNPQYMIGRNPRSVSAALIYIASIVTGHELRQSDAAAIAQVSEVTVRTKYQEIVELLDLPIAGGRIVDHR